jgi:hypothetical protein
MVSTADGPDSGCRNRSEVMRFKRFTIAALAAATVAVGSHATTPAASAMQMSCIHRIALAEGYIATGQVFRTLGLYQAAVYWYGKADGICQRPECHDQRGL